MVRRRAKQIHGQIRNGLARAGLVVNAHPPRQLELPMNREFEPDRNFLSGGRSFYFFDFDDNVAFLTTPIILFEKDSGRELAISSGEYAGVQKQVGQAGHYQNFEIRIDPKQGSFRNFRDKDIGFLERIIGRRQIFLQDLAAALGKPDLVWKGPSWSCFYHAVLNQRPVSLITARGHSPQTLKDGVSLLVSRQFLPFEPNYLSLYPVSHPETRAALGCKTGETPVPLLKRAAIRASVEQALMVYGESEHHRFGMSDDDPHNIALIVEEMRELKRQFPKMSFFVIETQAGRFVKSEVFVDHTEAQVCSTKQDFQSFEQLTLLR